MTALLIVSGYLATGFVLFILFWRYMIIDRNCGFERLVSLLILLAWPVAIALFFLFMMWDGLMKIGLMVMKK